MRYLTSQALSIRGKIQSLNSQRPLSQTSQAPWSLTSQTPWSLTSQTSTSLTHLYHMSLDHLTFKQEPSRGKQAQKMSRSKENLNK